MTGCLNYQQIKIEYQLPTRLLQLLPIVEWKWDCITMEFVIRFLKTSQWKDYIWVIMDKLTKSAHFLAIKAIDFLLVLSQLYIKEIVRLHGVPLSIVYGDNPRFTSYF